MCVCAKILHADRICEAISPLFATSFRHSRFGSPKTISKPCHVQRRAISNVRRRAPLEIAQMRWQLRIRAPNRHNKQHRGRTPFKFSRSSGSLCNDRDAAAINSVTSSAIKCRFLCSLRLWALEGLMRCQLTVPNPPETTARQTGVSSLGSINYSHFWAEGRPFPLGTNS